MSAVLATNDARLAEDWSVPEVPPPLETGDRLSRAEFHRRYVSMPKTKKAELIEGVVYMPSPVKYQRHSKPHSDLVWWLKHYTIHMSGVESGDNGTVLLDFENELQPDAFLLLPKQAGGTCRINEDDFVDGAPELVVEIASSSASYDLHDKKRAYRRNGVREYLVWVTRENRIEWWGLRDGEYVSLPTTDDGIIKSDVFTGLWLNAIALLKGDLAAVLAKLQEGLATEEAKAFQELLKAGKE
jgi:Uma2 family endonuclease